MIHTGLFFNELADVVGMVNLTVIKYKDTASARIGICQRDLHIFNVSNGRWIDEKPKGEQQIHEETA
jgi:hypothetical protein